MDVPILCDGAALFRTLAVHTSVGIFHANRDGTCVFVNDRWCQISGLTRERAQREPWTSAVHPDDRARVLAAWETFVSTGATFAEECRFPSPHGEITWAVATATTLHDTAGESTGYLGTITDVTGRREAAREAHEREEKLHAMNQGFDGFIYICSQDYRIEFMNKKFIERTGRDAAGEPCYRALHNREDVCPWCVNERVFKGETVRWEVQSPKDNRWYYIVNTPIVHADGSVSRPIS